MLNDKDTTMTTNQGIEIINRQTAAIARIREEMIAELAELEQAEPECECTQCSVDDYDPSTCEYHYSSSEWNRAVRRVEAAIAEVDAELKTVSKERKVA